MKFHYSLSLVIEMVDTWQDFIKNGNKEQKSFCYPIGWFSFFLFVFSKKSDGIEM